MKKLILISLLFAPLFSFGQLVTQVNMNAAQLVQNVLIGDPNVTISNVTYSGANGSLGTFTANNTNLGINSGIILTTGTVAMTANGPQGPNDQGDAGFDNGAPGYSVLTNIVGQPTFNASILSFDFQTCSDSIRFKYVFGSEEYPEYVGSNYNDVFGFFISGPGFSGQQNIARLPSGQVVAINSVNNGNSNPAPQVPVTGATNPQYFVYNGNGSQSPYNSSNQYIQYDGFTRVLTAVAKVQCNTTYHITIAIADALDAIYDSGIFLEAQSFTSSKPVTGNYQISQNLFNSENTMAESCVSTEVTLTRTPCNVNQPLTLNLSTSGTATEGVDYSNVPATVTFNPGQLTTNFTIDAFADGIPEPIENLILTFTYLDNCGNQKTDNMELFIQDITDVELELTNGNPTCPGEPIEITSSVSGGGEPYSYLWSTGETTPSILVSPTSTQTYTLTVTDDCLNQSVSASTQVVVPVYPPLVLNQTADLENICPYVPFELESNASGGLEPYNYQWSTAANPNLSTNSTYTAIPSTTTTYSIHVTDVCGQETSADIVYTILSPPLVLDMSPTVEICPGDSTEISVQPTGGYGQYFYEWFHSGETTQSVWVHPNSTTTYVVSVSDECQTFTVEGEVQVIVQAPTADFTISSGLVFNDVPVRFQNLSQNAVTYEWDFGDGQSSTEVHPNNIFDEHGSYWVTLIATDWKGCKDTIQKPIFIEEEWYIYVPNTFTPDQDQFNGTFSASSVGIKELSVQIFNRWGQLIFESQNPRFQWDGTYNGVLVPDGTYTYKINFTTNSGREKQLVGHINSLR